MKLSLSKTIIILVLGAILLVPFGQAWAAQPVPGAAGKYCYTVQYKQGWGSTLKVDEGCWHTLAECTKEWKKDIAEANAGYLHKAPDAIVGYWDKKVMSYCHLNNDGQDFSDGQVKNVSAINVKDPNSCWLGATQGGINVEVCLKNALSYVIKLALNVFSILLSFSSNLFNIMVQFSVYNFHDYANNGVIRYIWEIGRDIANVFFIFILLYIAIATIIQAQGVNWQRMVVQLIITALLINFSIIIPRVVIDIGNSLANVFYVNMGKPNSIGTPDITTSLIRGAQPSLLWKKSSLATTANPDPSIPSQFQSTANDLTFGAIFWRGIGTLILIFVLSFVLIMGAFMFVARSIVLLVVIAMSSLAFFSRIIPQTGGLRQLNIWDKWFTALLRETFFAPVFMFLFYLTLLMAQMAPTNTPPTMVGSTTNSVTSAPQIIWYALLIGLAIGALTISRSMSQWGASVANRLGMARASNWLRKTAPAFLGRNTAGRLATTMAESDFLKNMKTRQGNGVGSKIANFGASWTQKGLQAAGNAKFGGKQGFEGARKARAEDYKKRMEGMDAEEKGRFMANLSENDRTNLYQHGLSDEERTKIEGATWGSAIKSAGATELALERIDQLTSSNPAATPEQIKVEENAAREEYATGATRYLSDQRQGLTGDEKIKTYTQRVKGAKTAAEKLKLLDELKEDEKGHKAVIKALDEQSLARIKASPSFGMPTTDARIRDSINSRVTDIGLDVDSSEKYKKAEKAEKGKTERSANMTKIETLIKAFPSTPDPADIRAIRSLSGTEMMDLLEENSDIHTASPKFLGHLTKAQISAIANSSRVNQDVRDKIQKEIEDEATAGNAEAVKSNNWIRANPQLFP
ncbi:MAG: hypothetical protein NTY66_01810 [Candidatus Vogelbacteria bacterium]|nr:hypothetical protein [Candidatus Vogelbacteria bacterium]